MKKTKKVVKAWAVISKDGDLLKTSSSWPVPALWARKKDATHIRDKYWREQSVVPVEIRLLGEGKRTKQ